MPADEKVWGRSLKRDVLATLCKFNNDLEVMLTVAGDFFVIKAAGCSNFNETGITCGLSITIGGHPVGVKVMAAMR